MLDSLNPVSSCKKYGVSLWQCPQFLFLVMGIVIIIAIIVTYFLTTLRVGDPSIVSLLVLGVGAFLLIMNFIITNSFERMAEASKLKSEFIHIVSHQLRAPLTNIKFSLDFLNSAKMTQTKEQQQEYYDILKENSDRMNDLIDNLLTVAKIESGSFPLSKSEVFIENIAQKLIQKFKPFATASNIKLMIFSADHSLKVLADPLWIEQVMENLLDNAIKYTKGGGEVSVKVYQKKKKVFYEVHDNGVGVPKKDQKFVFQKFFRSNNSFKKQTGGTGLGLHIAKRIVEKTGGEVGFFSKENRGSTFWFSLPIK
ncbi:MAG: HAMP domain-containing sensor histidine kinase [Candidatus Pacebacteria bacterium]|nr:HAMP domain-containing sensor histidine kinase [Candidatus Paceibacterota bacterium]